MTEIAFGTYSCHGDLEPLVKNALKKGCKIFDTAPNYRHGVAQKELGEALKEAPVGLRIFSKVGFFSEKRAAHFLKKGFITEQEALLGHSLNPDYLTYQILQNLEELQLASLDTLFLHNPEKLFAIQEQHTVDQTLQSAFEVLENFCSQGVIKQYGVATWSGFETASSSYLDLRRLLSSAYEISQNHHFKAIQLPVSMVKIKPISDYFKEKGPLWFAYKSDLEIFGSSPLHGGKLPPLVGNALLNSINASCTPAQACLLFAKSIPNVRAILTSPSSLLQVEQSFDLSNLPILSEERVRDLMILLQQKS